jgi:hypothetical protein
MCAKCVRAIIFELVTHHTIWNLCAAVVALTAVAANSCDCGAMATSPMTMITMTVYFRHLILIEKMINNSKRLA